MSMEAYPHYVDVPGLQSAFSARGISCWWRGTDFYVSDLAAAQAIAASYDPVPAIKAQMTQAVRAKYEALIKAGVKYQDVLIAIDDASQGKITSMAAIASTTIAGLVTTAWPSDFVWLPQGTGASLPLATPQAMVTFGATVGHYVSAITLYADALATKIAAASTSAELHAIDITTGWPTN